MDHIKGKLKKRGHSLSKISRTTMSGDYLTETNGSPKLDKKGVT